MQDKRNLGFEIIQDWCCTLRRELGRVPKRSMDMRALIIFVAFSSGVRGSLSPQVSSGFHVL
jgi:hypothetical protein